MRAGRSAAGSVGATLTGVRTMQKTAIILAAILLAAFSALSGAPASSPLVAAIRQGDCRAVHMQLAAGADPNARDDMGATALMKAAAYAPLECLTALAERGALINGADSTGATPLMWATGDPGKVRFLLARGANPNAITKSGSTALTSAVLRGNTVVIQDLLAAGANPRVGDNAGTGLLQIAHGGNTCTVFAFGCNSTEVQRLLTHAGLTSSNLVQLVPIRPRVALTNGGSLVDFLSRNPQLNQLESFGVISVPAVAITAFLGDVDGTRLLLDRGADPSTAGTSTDFPNRADTTPLMLAAAAARPNPAVIRLLLDRGADVRPRDVRGRTALDWALLMGDTESARLLRAAGAVTVSPAPASAAVVPTMTRTARDAVQLAISRLQPVGPPFNKRGACISCHNESLPAIAVALARKHSVPVDNDLAKHPTDATLAEWKARRANFMLTRCLLAGFVANVGYGLLGMGEEGAPPTDDTDAATTCLAAMQRPDGSWHNMVDLRPPLLDSSPMPYTALAIYALSTYAPPGVALETKARVERGRDFLRITTARDTQDHVFKLLGLVWSKAPQPEISAAVMALRILQRSNGGWGQWPTMEPDAYATGQALYALHAAGTAANDATFREGARYLLRTQLQDGTWFVRSRAFAQQPFFDSGFPHDRDQYISAAATAWAAIALAYTL
jgi:ankyrin repeat protein